jgi:hypothetical protein
MQRPPLLLIAAFVEILRFFSLMIAVESVGLLGAGTLTASLLRYIAAPQLFFVIIFFFLWLDRDRYFAYRNLALAGKALALTSFLPLVLAFFGSLRNEGFVPLPRLALWSGLLVVLADLIALSVLLSLKRYSGSSGSGTGKETLIPTPAAQDPGIIEKVEETI